MRILVVDDEPDIRLSTKMLLELHGHVVDTAANGAEAIESAVASAPDVVLLDLVMPVMDGLTAARKLRELGKGTPLLIVAVSAYVSNREWCDRALSAGASACMDKPLDYPRLEALMSRRRSV